ncbi:hypothetical protein EON64_11870 [archaeon]|nr:MAG: hypothetical protein EON64_11870 [archaeon]
MYSSPLTLAPVYDRPNNLVEKVIRFFQLLLSKIKVFCATALIALLVVCGGTSRSAHAGLFSTKPNSAAQVKVDTKLSKTQYSAAKPSVKDKRVAAMTSGKAAYASATSKTATGKASSSTSKAVAGKPGSAVDGKNGNKAGSQQTPNSGGTVATMRSGFQAVADKLQVSPRALNTLAAVLVLAALS